MLDIIDLSTVLIYSYIFNVIYCRVCIIFSVSGEVVNFLLDKDFFLCIRKEEYIRNFCTVSHT